MTTATVEPKRMTQPEQLILAEVDRNVGIIRLNRPRVLNALNPELMTLLADQMEAWDRDETIHVILLTGSERAWAAGANRIWLHTNTLDHPAALPNYLKRGFKTFHSETYTPGAPPAGSYNRAE